MNTADRLEELRQGAISEAAPAAIVALDNVCQLAIKALRDAEQGGQVVQLVRRGDSLTRRYPTGNGPA